MIPSPAFGRTIENCRSHSEIQPQHSVPNVSRQSFSAVPPAGWIRSRCAPIQHFMLSYSWPSRHSGGLIVISLSLTTLRRNLTSVRA